MVSRNTLDAGTDGSGGLGALTLANSAFSGMALTPLGTAPSYSNTVTRRGLSLQFVTPAGTSYFSTPITGSPTDLTVTFYDWVPTAVSSTSEVSSVRNGATRIAALNWTTSSKFQFFGVSTTALWTSTLSVPLSGWYRTVYGYNAAGAWFCKIYDGDTTTVLDQGSGTGADFSSVGTPTILYIGKRSGGWTGTRYIDDPAWDPTFADIPATNPPSTTGPLGKIAHIGDSTSSQDGNGATNGPAAYIAAGWLSGDIWWYGVGGKDMSSADSNGKTVIQNIQDARAALGVEPKVWVIALGTNNRGQTDATQTTRVAAIMTEINSVGSPGRVLWVGISQSTAGGGLDANSVRFNNLVRTLMATYNSMFHTDLDSYLRNGRDESNIWYSPADANFAHMSVLGYTTLRNPYIASQARKLVSHADVNYTDLRVGADQVRALYVGGQIAWVKS